MADDGTTAPEHQQQARPTEDRSIPYDRFQQVVASKNAMAEKIGQLEQQLQSLTEKAATVDTLGEQLRKAQAQAQQAEQRFSTFRDIAGAGITDPDVVELVEWSYGRLPETDRPALGEWLTAIKTDPTTAPTALRPHLQAGGGESPPEPQQQKPPRSPAATSTAPGAQVGPTTEQLRAARLEAMKTGDVSKLQELRRQMRGAGR